MKLHIMSDLHMEFCKGSQRTVEIAKEYVRDADVLIIAGDLGIFTAALNWSVLSPLSVWAKHYKDVVYVLGNHEYYHGTLAEITTVVSEITDDLLPENVHVLEQGCVSLGHGINVVAATLWFPESPESATRQGCISDFRFIEDILSADDNVYVRAAKDMAYLNRKVKTDSVVVTHHLPSHKSVPERFRDHPANCYFVNPNAERLLGIPRLWIHGHTHDSCDYMAGDTRVVCNPFGYRDVEENPAFNPGLVIEV